jgi:NAD(P)-dependent dehydrogenase (short-subunit alcohol dehydrogenase family)
MSSHKPVALITGAGRGIGRGIALELSKNGFDIAGVDIDHDPDNKERGLFEVKERIEESKGVFVPIAGDVSSLDLHEQILEQAIASLGRIDVLVNNAGVAPIKRLDILETAPESYDRLLSVNTRGPFFLTQKVVKHMIDKGQQDTDIHRCVIFITSVSATISSPSRAEYCVSKAALSQAAKIYSDRLSEYGINVYEVRPGIIKTDMTTSVKEKYDRLISQGLVPQKRWGYPEDVAKAVASLARGDFSFSTGSIFEVSGGLNIQRL